MVATLRAHRRAARPGARRLDGGAHRGALPRPGLGADPVRQRTGSTRTCGSTTRRSRSARSIATGSEWRARTASTTAGIRDVVERAIAIAERSAPNPRAAVLPEPDGREHDPELGFVAATADASAERRAEGARAVIAAGEAKGLQSSGSFSTSVMTVAVANSHGIRARHRSTRAALLTVMMDGFGVGRRVGLRARRGDRHRRDRCRSTRRRGGRQGRSRCAARASWSPASTRSSSRNTPSRACSSTSATSASPGSRIEEGRSFMELGQQLMGENVSIWDDGADPTGMPSTIDFEGVARQRVDLIEQRRGQRGRPRRGHGCARRHRFHRAMRSRHRTSSVRCRSTSSWRPASTPRDELIGGRQARRVGHALPLHQPGPPEEGDPDRDDEGRHLPDRGRQALPPVMNFRFTQSIPEAFSDVRAIEPRDEAAARRVLRRRSRSGAASRLVQLHRRDRRGGRRVTMAARSSSASVIGSDCARSIRAAAATGRSCGWGPISVWSATGAATGS